VGDKPTLLCALPSYDGRRCNASAMVELCGIRNMNVRFMQIQSSLLALGFNKAWAAALDAEAEFFLLLHDDLLPVTDHWPAVLFDELTTNKASMLSVVSPIKTADGLTSTALETDDIWNPRRLSLAEVFARDETWTEPGLLVNTGLLLVDFRQDWVKGTCFTIRDRITVRDGQRVAEAQPEDWDLTRQARAAGASIFATRKVVVQHVGHASYDTGSVWGTQETDERYLETLRAPTDD